VTGWRVSGIDHVQLAIPPGQEERAIAFYAGTLRLEQIPKPDHLAGRGGCWFRGAGAELHLGVEEGFRPSEKAHPGLLVEGLAALRSALETAGADVVEDTQLEGRDRCYVHDPFGNRLELIEVH
jgi:catechol 2,3-dioxygenase-like lactoylglutathione lyase family enzyme